MVHPSCAFGEQATFIACHAVAFGPARQGVITGQQQVREAGALGSGAGVELEDDLSGGGAIVEHHRDARMVEGAAAGLFLDEEVGHVGQGHGVIEVIDLPAEALWGDVVRGTAQLPVRPNGEQAHVIAFPVPGEEALTHLLIKLGGIAGG